MKTIDKIDFMCYNTLTSVERLFLCANLGHAHISTLREVFNGLCPNLLGGAEKTMRVKVTLACTECKQRNYDTKKNKKNDPDRLEMKKHCRFCRKHTLHKETK